ncbi:MAG: hypothetical protein NTZ49_00965 [Candidatus Parcubacteria bacterium]|nr:hypothetical protein [Candidatus Parcubacteria bacterium]
MKKYLLGIALLAAFTLTGCNALDLLKVSKVLTPEEAKAKAEKFVNENLVQPGTTITIEDVVEENGLYKVVVNFSGQKYDSYMTKDGTQFFPQAYNIAEIEKEKASGTTAPATEVTKSDKPKVELFVMSHCPYGTQIEKGIIPVAETLKDKIDFEVKFCDYAMHGEKELQEELAQHCIKTTQNDKFISYLKCFLGEGKSEECRKQVSIDETSLKNCISKTDNEYKVMASFKDKTTWLSGQYPIFDVYKDDNTKYSVQGSPTLVINGAQAEAGRDSASLLSTICNAFNTQPEECKTQLSATAPSAGFGYEAAAATDTSASASCGN